MTNAGSDELYGGAGFDTYIVGANDVIEYDAANKGKIDFKGILEFDSSERGGNGYVE